MNPIRRVVNLLQQMQKKVEAEGKRDKELYEKFECYCKSGAASLSKSIEEAMTKIPQLESDIKEAESTKAQLDADVKGAQVGRDAAREAVAKAKELREKEFSTFSKESSTDKANIEALTKAIKAIEAGMSGGFLQSTTATVLRQLSLSMDMTSVDRDLLSNFLTGSSSQGYAPKSGEIVGILKQMLDTMDKDYQEVLAAEATAKSNFESLLSSKDKEINALVKEIEEKIKRAGEVAVEIVQMKEDLDDTIKSLGEDKKFLGHLDKDCEIKKKEYEIVVKTRQQELLALADTIKILNDDDALELFKKTLPSPSLLQVQTSGKQLREKALRALQKVRGSGKRNFGIDLIALALRGQKVNFDKVIKMIDDMVALLAKEQQDDNHKKEYCEVQLDSQDDRKKELEQSISDLEKAITESKEAIDTLASEIKALSDGIEALDKEVKEASDQRKAENEEYVASMANNNAALQIIEIAKNRLAKFYNPKLYKPPPKRELSEEERITLNMGGTLAPTNPPGGIAGTGVELNQLNREAPPPPPEAVGAYKKKGQESAGVTTMMDMLKAELEKEMTEMDVEEKDAQKDYEDMVGEASAKRAADTKSIAEKEEAKAATEADLIKAEENKASQFDELMATKEFLQNLHGECDWLLENFGARQEARAAEVDALKNAKAVLSGADFSFMQTKNKLSSPPHQK